MALAVTTFVSSEVNTKPTLALGCEFSTTVYVSELPSSTSRSVGLTITPGVATIRTSKLCAVVERSAPPPTLVSLSSLKALFVPSATVSASPSASATLSLRAAISSVAVCVPAPSKLIVGASVSPFRSVTPVLSEVPLFADSVKSDASMPVPERSSGTSMRSPATSARPSVTVNSAVPPSVTAPEPTRANDTTVASSSRMVSVYVSGPDKLTGLWAGIALSSNVNVTVSSGSSMASLCVAAETVKPKAALGISTGKKVSERAPSEQAQLGFAL